MELIRRGSSKDIYRADGNSLAFRFTNFFSVFDVGRSTYAIPGKGKAVCDCAVRSFEIAEAIGLPTHFIEQIDETTVRVKEASVISDRPLTMADENYVVPVELIYRLSVAGSIHRDFVSGKKKPEDYGLGKEIPAIGTPFPYPVHMTTTKLEDIDREIGIEEVCHLAGMSVKDLDEYWSMIDRMTGAAALRLCESGFILLDGKAEMLMGPGRKKMFGDNFITPDEDRPAKIVDGKIVHYSKEYIRELLIANGYYAKLMEARKSEAPDLPIPYIGDEAVAEVSRRYAEFTKAYANTRIVVML